MDRLVKHGGKAGGSSLVITKDDKEWVELQFGEDVVLDGEKLKSIVGEFRELLGSASVSNLRSEKLHFPTGQALMDYAKEVQSAPSEGEVIQPTLEK